MVWDVSPQNRGGLKRVYKGNDKLVSTWVTPKQHRGVTYPESIRVRCDSRKLNQGPGGQPVPLGDVDSVCQLEGQGSRICYLRQSVTTTQEDFADPKVFLRLDHHIINSTQIDSSSVTACPWPNCNGQSGRCHLKIELT